MVYIIVIVIGTIILIIMIIIIAIIAIIIMQYVCILAMLLQSQIMSAFDRSRSTVASAAKPFVRGRIRVEVIGQGSSDILYDILPKKNRMNIYIYA